MMKDCGFSVFLWIIYEQEVTILNVSKVIVKEATYRRASKLAAYC